MLEHCPMQDSNLWLLTGSWGRDAEHLMSDMRHNIICCALHAFVCCAWNNCMRNPHIIAMTWLGKGLSWCSIAKLPSLPATLRPHRKDVITCFRSSCIVLCHLTRLVSNTRSCKTCSVQGQPGARVSGLAVF